MKSLSSERYRSLFELTNEMMSCMTGFLCQMEELLTKKYSEPIAERQPTRHVKRLGIEAHCRRITGQFSRECMPNVAVVLFQLGGPDSIDAVGPFLYNLFRDPRVTKKV